MGGTTECIKVLESAGREKMKDNKKSRETREDKSVGQQGIHVCSAVRGDTNQQETLMRRKGVSQEKKKRTTTHPRD